MHGRSCMTIDPRIPTMSGFTDQTGGVKHFVGLFPHTFGSSEHRLVVPPLRTPRPRRGRGTDHEPDPSPLRDIDVVRVPKSCALCPTHATTAVKIKDFYNKYKNSIAPYRTGFPTFGDAEFLKTVRTQSL